MPTKPSEPDEGWVQLASPRICERMIGFSVPRDDSVLVVSYGDERLTLDTKTERGAVLRASTEVWSTRYENFTGDWTAVTFSTDRRFIVLGCPYDFDFRVWERRTQSSDVRALHPGH